MSKSDTVRERVLRRMRAANPCTPEQQAGDWWDAERKVDSRLDQATKAGA